MTTTLDLEHPGPPLTLQEIEALEEDIGGRLPDDYKRFLLSHNGGIARPEVGFPWEGEIEEVGLFYSLLPECDRGVLAALEDLRELNADGFLPVAWTTSEQEVCVAFGKNVGAVFLTVYTYKKTDWGGRVRVAVTMAPLASSFTEFLDSLVEIPDPYCRIVDLGKQGTPEGLAQYLAEGNSIDALGKHNETIVCEAVKFDNVPMIRACIEHDASLCGTLHIAVRGTRIHLIELLVQAGADVNERDEWGCTPLEYLPGTALPGEEGARNRESRELLIKLGAVDYEEDLDRAFPDFQEAIRLDPRYADAAKEGVLADIRKGEFGKSIADCTEAVRVDPQSAKAYSDRARAYCQSGEYDKAVADCSEAIRLDPGLVEAYIIRGIAYRHMEEYEMAIADCTEAIRLDPNCAAAYISRGHAYGEQDDYDRAILDFTESIRLDPTCADAYWDRATCYVLRSEKAKEEKELARAKRLGDKGR